MDSYITVKDISDGLYQPLWRIYKYIKEGRFDGSYKKLKGKYIFNRKKCYECLEKNFHHNNTVCID